MPTSKAASAKPKTAAKKAKTSTAAARSKGRGSRGAARTTAAAPARARNRGPHDLVIVESPAKARTLAGILGPGYEITASVGHVRDLPRSKLGVDIDNQFEPHYVVPKEKRDVVNRIREAASTANTIFLATDPDREGEAISWHLVEAADLARKPLQRVVFHEITPQAIREAFEHPREVDSSLVDAYHARRILDRLVGYKISPLLWRKVKRGTSAGRVQSAALRMVVEREREILNFQAREYWTIDALLAKLGGAAAAPFSARLRGIAGQRTFEIPSAEDAERISADLRSASYEVKTVRRRDQHRRPAPPFTTSTLQQEASRRFGFTARRTMALAQQLYEGMQLRGSGSPTGLITYMRTDSTNLAEVAVTEIRGFVAQRFGADFLPNAPRVYKSRKGAQEAHEAIRPTSVVRTPESAELGGLNNDQRRLYTLIWQRAVACQMADAVLDSVAVDIDGRTPDGATTYHLRASASVVRFPGYRQVYEEARDDDEEAAVPQSPLPDLEAGNSLQLRDVRPEQHFTEPPPRYTEATLVKGLEENGIGRPSTYASILGTIQERGYVDRVERQLRPTELGFVVHDFLIEQFPDYVDLKFTADFEEDLDEIANGVKLWRPVVEEFYNPLSKALLSAENAPVVSQETGELCPESQHPLIRRFGRFGPFLACSGFPECRYTRPDKDEEQPEVSDEKCDVCGSQMAVKRGRFGPFLACTRYPECKGTKPLLMKTGIPCPLDNGEIVERQTKKGRKFYGCANYPKCEFSSWQRPLPTKCPNCGGLAVAERGRSARCTVCEWKGPSSATIDPGAQPREKAMAPAGVT
jgi:DNA topoisomerase-1